MGLVKLEVFGNDWQTEFEGYLGSGLLDVEGGLDCCAPY
jgi:hypothetical protein